MVSIAKNPASEAGAQALESSFLDLLPPPVGGLPDRLIDHAGRPFGPALCKLTPWRHHLLLGYGSPFVTRAKLPGAVTAAEVLQALYLCGPAYRSGARFGFRWFALCHGRLVRRRRFECIAALSLWLDAAFSTMPPMPSDTAKDGRGRPQADVHWLAGWVRTGRKLLGLGEAEVLHMPYIRLWQYLDLELASDPARPAFDRRKTKKAGEYLRRKNQPAPASP